MTLSMDEAGRPICSVLPQDDAHRWPWSDDRRTMRPTGWGKYGYTGVHEIVSGTLAAYGVVTVRSVGAAGGPGGLSVLLPAPFGMLI